MKGQIHLLKELKRYLHDIMKVSVVTGYTPTPENTRGISGLIYSILRFRPKDIEIKVYSYNFNEISESQLKDLENDLSAHIVLQQSPCWSKLLDNVWFWRLWKFFMKRPPSCYMVTNDLVKQIQNDAPDLIWIYPYYFYKLALRLPEQSCVVTGCDCEALIRVRNFDTRRGLMNEKALRHNYIMLKKGLTFEREWNQPNLQVHLVGMEDYNFYERIYGYNNAHFLLHPHYSLVDKMIDFSKPKLKVIIAGSYDIYMEEDVDKMLPNLLKYREDLLANFEFTVLGKKWGKIQEIFNKNCFPCDFKTWVDDYAAELVSHDIQLTPISYGTGTKGKVLSALGNGLLVVGSKYAFENICVRNKESCLMYRNAEEIASLLLTIARNKEIFQSVAEKGRSQVRTYHNPERISKRFFEIYGK